ncbi:amidohydrolase [Agromyces sp. NBRC 114283]|uniref:amidohydrolase n=1 Tax=Agromyces sp. NBRC 114283 TaxID=2994521 RepID=UPI0024A35ADD|nr:amidohydrolase [Agromyces sp. NBRC 114283]GLU90169.1 amidohydrolase [Agromyces sp. NBRC 114283]
MTAKLTIVDCTLPLLDGGERRHAVTVEGERIARVMPMAELGSVPGEVLDAAGRSLLPGFTDAHVHLVESGIELARCDLSLSRSRAHALELIDDYCRRMPNEPWIVGRGWSLDHFADTATMLVELDRLTGERPAYLSNKDGHSAWVNSAALRRAGITARTPDPDGGRIERDASGAPSGLLHEGAMLLVAELIPPLDEETRFAGLLAGQQRFFSLGITGWQEAIVGDFVPTTDVERSYRRAIDSGALLGQVTGNLWLRRTDPAGALDELIARRAAFAGDERFRASGVKIMYDGVCETLTGAVSVPYLDPSGQHGASAEPNRGITFFDPAELAPVVVELDRAGFDLHAHVIGDRATDEVLAMIEAAQRQNPARDRRHQLAHLQLLNPGLISRMAAAGVIANVQPYWAQADAQMVEMTLPFLDASLHDHHYAFRSLELAGVPLAFGSDWPVTTPSPFDWIHVAVNRSYPGDSTEPFLPHEALSRDSALRAATSGAAHAVRQDELRGRIEPGLLADLVLLDAELREVPDAELHAVQADTTLARGAVVFERG